MECRSAIAWETPALYDKFMAWARTVPYTLRNPLYHWTHLELKRYFDIDDLLDETTGPAIWDRTSAALQHDQLTAHGILRRFDVKAVCTSDDPTDSLEEHKKIARSGLATKVYPTFRPDKALQTADVPAFNAWVDRLAHAPMLKSLASMTISKPCTSGMIISMRTAAGCRIMV